MADIPALSDQAASFLSTIEQRIERWTPARTADRVSELVATHDERRGRRCLNMNPAESLLSSRCRRLLASDMATRLTEGLPGDKLYPHGAQNQYIDEIEAIIIALAKRQFGARYLDWRPVSTSMANAAVFSALLRPGDVLLSQDEDGGGNYSYHKNGAAGLCGAKIVSAPREGEAFEIDLDRLALLVKEVRPKLIAFGGSNVLFPYPVRRMRELADQVGAMLLYDAAHVGLLISSGDFQRPLQEGAHVVTVSTHKIMGGPVGGLIFTDDRAIADRILKLTFPGLMQTRDQNKYAALAVALAETAEFGPQLAQQMVANARALARALEDEGYNVLARERGYTQTHQIFLELGADAKVFETRCNLANILLSDCALSGDQARRQRNGARLATHELTRTGMKEAQMHEVARLIARAARDAEDPQLVARDVEQLLTRHQRVAYSFDEGDQ
jgi:glycine hydroxymethyltransferase